jgi:hypothetical protein
VAGFQPDLKGIWSLERAMSALFCFWGEALMGDARDGMSVVSF